MNSIVPLSRIALTVAVVVMLASPSPAIAADSGAEFQALEWRHVGPPVGGRGTAVMGHPTDDQVFWYGMSTGGLWKTEDAGQYWLPVGDGQFKMGSVGAIALDPANPDIMYVGMGEPNQRDSVSWGDGVYKTVDGGATWTHLGLETTMAISRIRVHPTITDIVYVAAIGNPFGPSADRGIYRTTDGGETWEQIFFKSDVAGAIDLVLDPTNPDNLYATVFQLQRKTWQVWAGGPDSGIWRSNDGGDTWEDITRNPGLPQTGDLGRVGLGHSPAMPNRISALVDSEEKAGLYQSEDGGDTWTLISNDTNITVRPFYFYHLYASPVNGDELWVLTNKLWQSLDGGTTWIQRSGTKDDFHDMWMDPRDSDRMIVTHDGGTQVSLTGGKTWTGVYTQRNAQLYRLDIDDEFPYRLYSSVQDLICYRVPSASVWGGISMNDVKVMGTGESGQCVPHPDDPNLVFHLAQSSMASGGGPIQRINLETEQYEHVNVWPMITFGRGQKHAKYRFNWHAPILIDPFEHDTIYTAAEYVFRSRDKGQSWEIISPELTFDDETKQERGGSPWMPETSGQEAYNTIHRMVASPHEKGVLWVGSDDGRLHITRDGGETWTDISPDWLEWSDIYEIAPSPHDPGSAYVAVTRYRTANDFTPFLYKFTDYGAKVKTISGGFPQGEITRTIVEDPARKGLLFVGTETGVFASFDDGVEWRRMNLNLPAVPVHAVKVKHEDLVIATHGRGFWILDDISPLRQWNTSLATKKAHLFTPRATVRLGRNWWAAYGGGVFGGQKNYFVQNQRPGHTFIELGIVNGERKRMYLEAGDARPDGAIIYYLLSDEAKDVKLEILDTEGNLIKTFGEEEIGTQTFETIDGLGYGRVSPAGGSGAVSIAKGLNRFVWDMTYTDATRVPGRPPAGIVPMAKPGTHQVRLTVDGEEQTQNFELKINPNEKWTQADADARFDLWMRVREIAERANTAIIASRETVEKFEQSGVSGTQLEQVKKAQAEFEQSIVPVGQTLVQIANEPAKLLPKLATVHHMLYSSEGRPPQSAYMVVDTLEAEINAEIAVWKEFEANAEK
ncbi:MAG: glycosyl hydrolase [Acidobacteriota bacterium]|nr:glycosyl hydrolase [Acidobacteriota bacterium]